MMQIMDIFPQIATQLDTAMKSYRSSGAKKEKNGSQFSDVLSAMSEASEPSRKNDGWRIRNAEAVNGQETTVKKTEDADDIGDMGEMIEDDTEEDEDALALAALAQGNVVLILEGNKEIDTAAGDEPAVLDDSVAALGTVAAETGEGVPAPAPQTEAQDEGIAERMARMPDVTDKPRDGKSTSELEGSGDLCPLENENEVDGTKGKKDKGPRLEQYMTDKKAEDAGETPERVIPTNQTVDVRPERLSSAESLKGAATGQPVTQDNLFDAMVDRIETMQEDGMNKMSIQLKPEFLGKVSLQLSMTAAGLQVRINADDLNVRNAIGGQIQALIETLSSKGVAIADVEVIHTGVGAGDFTNQQGGGSQPEQSAPSRRYARGDAGDITDFDVPSAEDPVSALDVEVSSVEYRA